MSQLHRTIVTFQSSQFNATESHDYFINPDCFGDDLCLWLIDELTARGVQCDSEPGQEDFGWYFNFQLGETVYCLVCGCRPPEADEPALWTLWIERSTGFISSLFGGRNKGIELAAGEKIHEALFRSPYVENVLWHLPKDYEAGREESAVDSPG